MKACSIYKTESAYKIVTEYNLDIGYYRGSIPVFIVKMADKDDLITMIHKSLDASTDIDSCVTLSTKEYLRQLKEPSLKKLYSQSKNCFVRLSSEKLIITPYELDPSGRYLQEKPDGQIRYSLDTINDDLFLSAVLSALE
jgi:hypothetical protein